MRVLHLLDSLNRGGAETLCLDVCRNARRHKLDLTFVATGGGELEADFRQSGADFVRLTRRSPLDLKLIGQLRQLIKEREIEVVHCHQAVEALHVYLATRSSSSGIKRVLSFHLCAADAKNRVALKFLAPRMDANVAVSRELLACLKVEGGFQTAKNFHVIYNGVDAARLQPADGSGGDGGGDLRAELNLPQSDLLLGMVGNFYADGRKDQLTVCRALPAVFRRLPDARFVFAGGYAEAAPQVYQECVNYCREQGINDRVHFLGGRADIANVLDALDLFVFSSRRDSFGVAVVEAMLKGVPAVVSDIGALLEVSGGGEYASVFRTGDADDLARRLVELGADRERRVQLRERARRWAASEFSIEAHLANLLKLYKALRSVP